MNDHLGKPFSSQQLFDRLQPWLKTQDSVTVEPYLATEAMTHLQSKESPKPCLLIVDDMNANIKILANLLKEEYIIKVANNGQKALAIANSTEPPDLILLDILMPDMDGYEICRELKNHAATSRIPLIFISALDEVGNETKGLNLGAVDYITKPFHPEIVKARVRNHMSLKIKTDLLETMSNIDGLTQIANRRSFDTHFEKEVRRARRTGKSLGLMMLDIDFFKAYNDHYGHGKGDECLIKVASELQQVISRPGDLLARYGGEEFVILLPEMDQAGTELMAERMRLKVEQLSLKHEYSSISDYLTISLGYATRNPDDQDFDDILKLADQALYRAKQLGRNRTEGD